MSDPLSVPDPRGDGGEDLGSLSIEDDPDGTVDPADLAGGADEEDSDSELRPTHSENDLED